MTERYRRGGCPRTAAAPGGAGCRYGADVRGRHGPPGAARRRGVGLPAGERGERVHRRGAAVEPGQGSGQRRARAGGAVRRVRGGAHRGRAAAAGDALVGGRDPAPDGETEAPGALRLDTAGAWRASGERAILNAGALWPRLDDKGAITVTDANTPTSPAPTSAPASSETTAPAAAPPAAAAAPAVAPPAAQGAAVEQISIDDFMKVQLKVAKILEAARVPKSKKLVQLSVDVGEAAPRTILAGIAESYEPEQLVGKSIVVVANLKPAKLMGIESNGMVLAASPEGGGAIVLNAEPATPGTRVR
ncbi:MAG: methionine--tRNA ligase subunit beta [Vicinamibacterales bacterium]